MNFRQVHLDFHTSEKIPEVGAAFDKKEFQDALRIGHVNSVTVFAKCHHGWFYYRNGVTPCHPTLRFDLLTAQIQAAHEIGVKVPIYISAGLDERTVRQHPEWLVRNQEEATTWCTDLSQAGYHKFCMNSPYLDKLLAETRDVCRHYKELGIDGLFFDICGVQVCYCQNCVNSMLDRGWDPYDPKQALRFAEEVYDTYAKKIRAAVDETDPSIHIFHNAGHIRKGRRGLAHYNSHLELESLPTGGWGYDHFPQSARYVQQFGMDFLGMTGKFHLSWGEFGGFKHPNALRYECALALANGAKISVGDQLHPSGRMDPATYRLIGESYAEVEKKEPWLDGVTSVADVGVFSYEAYLELVSEGEEVRNNPHDNGAVRMMLEGKYLFDMLDYDSDFSRYRVILLPDRIRMAEPLRQKLAEFVANGGKLLASGTSALYETEDRFAFDLGADYVGVSKYHPSYLHPHFSYTNVEDTAYVMYGQAQEACLSRDGVMHAMAEPPYFNRSTFAFCSHRHTPNGRQETSAGVTEGKDGMYIAFDIFCDYAENGALIAKRTVQFALDRLLGEKKALETTLPAQGVTTLMEQTDAHRYVSHLLYASPVRRGADVEIIEDIVPLYDIQVTYRLPKKIQAVFLEPQHMPLSYTEKTDGTITLIVPKLENHQMVVLHYEQ